MRKSSLGLVGFFGLALAACGGGSGGTSTDNGSPPSEDVVGAPGASPGPGSNPSPSAQDAGSGARPEAGGTDSSTQDHLQTVFLIMMENHSLSTITGSSHATYINTTLMPKGGHATAYSTPPGNHPSELNYIWLEAGGTLGITTDDDPDKNHKAETKHLSTLLDKAGISWKAYVEDISGNDCPLASSGKFVTRHTPQLFFDDVTDKNSAGSANCKKHIRPYGELATDLTAGTVARYNFITPNLCNDMHGLSLSCGTQNFNEVGAGDAWLKAEVPKILESPAFKNNGVLFILWDEGDESLFSGASDGPIPMIVLSPKAKTNFKSATPFTHSSMLRTVQEIFGVTPLLGDAANAKDLSEFFTSFP